MHKVYQRPDLEKKATHVDFHDFTQAADDFKGCEMSLVFFDLKSDQASID